MKHFPFVLVSLLVLPAMATVKTQIIDSGGKEVGTIKIEPAKKGVKVTIEAKNLPAGTHGAHFIAPR